MDPKSHFATGTRQNGGSLRFLCSRYKAAKLRLCLCPHPRRSVGVLRGKTVVLPYFPRRIELKCLQIFPDRTSPTRSEYVISQKIRNSPQQASVKLWPLLYLFLGSFATLFGFSIYALFPNPALPPSQNRLCRLLAVSASCKWRTGESLPRTRQ